MSGGIARNAIIVFAVATAVVATATLKERGRAAASRNIVEEERGTARSPGLPRLLDLGADKCIPCRQMAPILVELKTEYAGRATIDFIDVWKNPKAGQPYGIRTIPTQIFFDRNGKETWRHEGFLAKDAIVNKLEELGAR